MIAKQFLVTGFLMVAFAMGCSRAESTSSETWDTVNAKLSKFDRNDCDGAWHLFWSTRENNETYSYLMLSALAARGEHPWQPADARKNDDIAFSLAVLAYRNGQIPKLGELGEGFKADSLFAPLAFVRALILRLSSEKGRKYYDPSSASCIRLGDELNASKFNECFGNLLKNAAKENATITIPPVPVGSHVACVEYQGFDFR